MVNSYEIVDKLVDDSVSEIKISSKNLSRLRVAYRLRDSTELKKMSRKFMLVSQQDAEINTQQLPVNEGVVEFKIDPKQLKKHSEFKLYTVAIPTDPELAKRIRVRRVLLAIIEWKKG